MLELLAVEASVGILHNQHKERQVSKSAYLALYPYWFLGLPEQYVCRIQKSSWVNGEEWYIV
jgi:hypothetical protein